MTPVDRRRQDLAELTRASRCKQALVELTRMDRGRQDLVELTLVSRCEQALVELTRGSRCEPALVELTRAGHRGAAPQASRGAFPHMCPNMTCEEWAWWQDKVSQNALLMNGY